MFGQYAGAVYLRAPRFAGAAESAFFAAHLALSASDSLLLPAGVIPPLRLALAGATATAESVLFAAHRALSASESLLRPSGVMPPFRFALRGPRLTGSAAGVAISGTEPSMSRRAAKARSIPALCCSSFLITSFKLFAIFCPCRPVESTNTNHSALDRRFLSRY
jgi:hypothetical protein